jgi:UDP-N-acetyl-D-galactosamine dehydrogenase
MLKKDIRVLDSNILILGFTFKENCPDVRNTKVIDIYNSLKEYNLNITVYDPLANQKIVKKEYNLIIDNTLPSLQYDAVILAVAHEEFHELPISCLVKNNSVIYDVKGFLSKNVIDGRL